MFTRPTDISQRRETFQDREVGITHPDLPSFIKIKSDGQLEIFASPGLGIVFDPHTKSCNIFADNIKFFTKDVDGMRWNEFYFNCMATNYVEPALIRTTESDVSSVYDGWDDFLE